MMKFKEVALSDASTDAKVAGLALLLDKELLKLSELVLNTKKLQGPKGEQGLQGPKGEQGDKGFDGTNGKDGANGADGKDGEDGKQGVGVQDAHIDFDGSLVIVLTDGTEINAGDVVPMDVAEKIKVIGNGGGTSQAVLDAIDAINAIIATYGTMALQDDTSVDINGGAIDGTTVGATTASTGAFTTLSASSTVSGTGFSTYLASPPAIGGTTPAAGTFTTLTASALTATGQTSLGGAAGSESVRVTVRASATDYISLSGGSAATGGGYIGMVGAQSANSLYISASSTGGVRFYTNSWQQEQLRVSHTASAVNYVQVTGSATGSDPIISAQGSDSNKGLRYAAKGGGGAGHRFFGNSSATEEIVRFTSVNGGNAYFNLTGGATGISPVLSVAGSDTNIDLTLTPKGTGGLTSTINSGSFTVTRNSGTNTMKVTAANTQNLALQSTGGGAVYLRTGDDALTQFVAQHNGSAVNYLQATGSATGSGVTLSAQGSDTNIDLTLTPKGTGNVKFGTYTADMTLVVQGYITIKDSGGTVRKLAVIA